MRIKQREWWNGDSFSKCQLMRDYSWSSHDASLWNHVIVWHQKKNTQVMRTLSKCCPILRAISKMQTSTPTFQRNNRLTSERSYISFLCLPILPCQKTKWNPPSLHCNMPGLLTIVKHPAWALYPTHIFSDTSSVSPNSKASRGSILTWVPQTPNRKCLR